MSIQQITALLNEAHAELAEAKIAYQNALTEILTRRT